MSTESSDREEGWWRKNAMLFFSLVVSIAALGVSFWNMHTGSAADSRAQRDEASAASAAATKLVGQVDRVVKQANTAQQFFDEASNERTNNQKWSADLISALNESDLAPLSPTNDDFAALSRLGDKTSGHLQSCVKLRDAAEDKIKFLAKGKNKLFDPVESAYVLELTWDLSSVTKACTQALSDLQPLSVPDPELDLPPPQGVIERYPTLPPPPWLAHPSSVN